MAARAWIPLYDFWMCRKCKHVLTDLQMNRAMSVGESPCPCGSLHFQPTNPPRRWWLRPAIVWFWVLRTLHVVPGPQKADA
jgi:hypothetical protein